MNLEKLGKAFGWIGDAIRRFFGWPESAAGNTHVNGSKPLDQDKPPISDPSQLGAEPPNPESSTSSKNPGSPNSGDDIPGEDIPSQEEPSVQTKTPTKMPGKRNERDTPKPPKRERPPPEEKPELICRETRDRSKWEIFLTTPQGKSFVVSQNKVELSAGDNGEYLPTSFKEKIHWTYNKNDEEIELFNDDRPLIFKLRKEWSGDGRHIPRISSGYYLVFTPCEWHRINDAPISESACTDNDFLAHYFYSDGTGTADGFKECNSFIKRERFSLNGTTVADDANMGELYVGDIPKLDDNENWEGISWIQVGKEDGDTWAKNLKPGELNLADVLQDREGWFFIRIYDADVKLIHSMDFRYLANLEKILVNGEPHHSDNIFTPGDNGYVDAVIQFVGEVGVESENKDIAVSKDNTAIIDSLPNLDKTQWTLIGRNGQVTINLHLPRIWWQLVNSNTISDEWKDTPFEMSRDEFRNNRNAAIIVHLPSTEKEIHIGFNELNQYGGARKYLVKSNEDTKYAEFRLRDFCAHTEIAKTSFKRADLRIQCDKAILTVVHVPPDLPEPEPEPEKNLSHPVTSNKGFSHGELCAAGLTSAKARYLGIRADHRRSSMHCVNIKALQKQSGENHAD